MENTNKINFTEVKENKTKIESATFASGPIVTIIDRKAKEAADLAAFSGLLGWKIPEKKLRTIVNKRYMYSAKALIDMGMAIDAGSISKDGFRPFTGAINPELMVMTLMEYFKRTTYTARRVEHDGKVDCQMVKRPEMVVSATREYSAGDWAGQEMFFTASALHIAAAITPIINKNGEVYLAFQGKNKPMFVKLQAFAKA